MRLSWQHLPLADRRSRVACDGSGQRRDPPYPPAINAAAERGYDLTSLRARQITGDDFHDFDLILAMDEQNLSEIERIRPAGAATRVRLFMDYAPETGVSDVPDPYYTRDFDGALNLIEKAAQGLLKTL